jgi:hypothetical protein
MVMYIFLGKSVFGISHVWLDKVLYVFSQYVSLGFGSVT